MLSQLCPLLLGMVLMVQLIRTPAIPQNGTDGAHKDPSGLHLLQPLHETLGNSASCDKKIHNSIYVAEGHGSSSLEPSRCLPSYGSPGKMNQTILAYAQAI